MKPEPIEEFVFNAHALLEMSRRELSEETVHAILYAPGQRFEIRPGRHVLQSRVQLSHPARPYLVRVFVDIDRQPAEIVTAYRTSKIWKILEGR